MPITWVGSGAGMGDGIQKGISSLGDAFLGYLRNEAQQPLIEAQARKLQSDIASGEAQRKKMGIESALLDAEQQWVADGASIHMKSPQEQQQWALRGYALKRNPEQYISGMAQRDFYNAAHDKTNQLRTDNESATMLSLAGRLPLHQYGQTAGSAEAYQRRNLDNELQKERMQQAGADRRSAARDKAEFGGPKAIFEGEHKLRGEFNNLTKDMREIISHANNVQAAYTQGGSAGDQALVFALSKMLDPGSVVREGEYDRIAKAGGVAQQVFNLKDKWMRGMTLPPAVREEFVSLAKNLEAAAGENYKGYKAQYSNIATQYGMSPERVTLGEMNMNQRITAQTAPAPGMKFPSNAPVPSHSRGVQRQQQSVSGAPTPGTVMDGYRFKGGNPADPASWERM